jgi:SAM-dependent methyltransferase
MSDVRHTEDQLRAIAAQLAHPDGEAGIAMGHTMNDSNTGMVLRTIAALEVQDGDRVLELGHGNCIHLESLLAGKSDVRYHGLEISGTMHRASVAANAHFISDGCVQFSLYDGATLPFPDAAFTKVFTVNTLYFWAEPAALLRELHRVLRPGGSLCVAYAQRTFMEKLPFTRFGFELYDDARFAALAEGSAFMAPSFIAEREMVTSKDGHRLLRTYAIATLVK